MLWGVPNVHNLVPQEREKPGLELAVVSVPSYACQRHTPLLHHNTILTVSPSHNPLLTYEVLMF